MSVDSLATSLVSRPDGHIVCFHQKQEIVQSRFIADIQQQACWLQQQNHSDYALFYESAYPFAVTLFALFLAKKKIWIPGNNRPATERNLQKQGCQLLGEWSLKNDIPKGADRLASLRFDARQCQLFIYTSGSTGQPKAIAKTLAQLEAEIEALERLWGERLAHSVIVATVSHQHIYGLLFKLLWPLAAGRCFYSTLYLSPEAMLNAAADKSCCWIASPAQLKRLDRQSPWAQIVALNAIFSSGGPLSADTAEKILTQTGRPVIEVYGSSETGGIAWRQQLEYPLWRPLPGVSLRQQSDKTVMTAPWLDGVVILDDAIVIDEKGDFDLQGRRDRIVKIEEKRLSLTELEQVLQKCKEIEAARVFLLPGKRDRLGAALVLSTEGFDKAEQIGRAIWIKEIKQLLLQQFENVMLPKKWLFLNRFPETTQGKIDVGLLCALLNQQKNRFPIIQSVWISEHSVKLKINIHSKLDYFDGHFPQQPILPGVTQLAWADYYGHLFFNIANGFSRLEAVKFKKTIMPDTRAVLSLDWKDSVEKLYFDLSSNSDSYGSGRMIFQAD